MIDNLRRFITLIFIKNKWFACFIYALYQHDAGKFFYEREMARNIVVSRRRNGSGNMESTN